MTTNQISRRDLFKRTGTVGLGIAVSGSLGSVLGGTGIAAAAPAKNHGIGYGPLVPDPNGLLDLPKGFSYKVISRGGIDTLQTGEPVPTNHDGMGAFTGRRGLTVLVLNHELSPGATYPVPHLDGITYDPEVSGGTTTLVVSRDGELQSQRASLAGTARNCAGGITPWGTWLTCEENFDVNGKPHGYVFEVDPRGDGNPEPISAMGRREHEAVAIDPCTGVAYLTEDASNPFGFLYRFLPVQPLGGTGSLHAGGTLQAMHVPGVPDLSAVSTVGTRLGGVSWLTVPTPDVPAGGTPNRTQVAGTPIRKAEGCWWDWREEVLYFDSSFARASDGLSGVHDGQIWKYDPEDNELTLVAQLTAADPYDGPDNITVSPYGGVLFCEDGDGEQFIGGVDPDGNVYALARNAVGENEFAGAVFSPTNAKQLFVNIQDPAITFVVTGPFHRLGRRDG